MGVRSWALATFFPGGPSCCYFPPGHPLWDVGRFSLHQNSGKVPLSLSFRRMSTFTPASITKELPSGILPRMKEISEVTSCRFIGEKVDIQIGAPLAFKEILSHQAHL